VNGYKTLIAEDEIINDIGFLGESYIKNGITPKKEERPIHYT
jgi:hypothetical protein